SLELKLNWSSLENDGPHCFLSHDANFDLSPQLWQHPRAFREAKRQLATVIVPRHLNSHPFSAVVIERAAVVFVQKEVSICAGINLQRQWTINLFTCVLLHRPKWNDGAGSRIQRHSRQINRSRNLATAFDFLFRPEVVPHATRQIELSRRGAFFSDWRHKHVAAPKVFVSTRHCDRIVGIMQPESAQDRQSRLTTLTHSRVKV